MHAGRLARHHGRRALGPGPAVDAVLRVGDVAVCVAGGEAQRHPSVATHLVGSLHGRDRRDGVDPGHDGLHRLEVPGVVARAIGHGVGAVVRAVGPGRDHGGVALRPRAFIDAVGRPRDAAVLVVGGEAENDVRSVPGIVRAAHGGERGRGVDTDTHLSGLLDVAGDVARAVGHYAFAARRRSSGDRDDDGGAFQPRTVVEAVFGHGDAALRIARGEPQRHVLVVPGVVGADRHRGRRARVDAHLGGARGLHEAGGVCGPERDPVHAVVGAARRRRDDHGVPLGPGAIVEAVLRARQTFGAARLEFERDVAVVPVVVTSRDIGDGRAGLSNGRSPHLRAHRRCAAVGVALAGGGGAQRRELCSRRAVRRRGTSPCIEHRTRVRVAVSRLLCERLHHDVRQRSGDVVLQAQGRDRFVDDAVDDRGVVRRRLAAERVRAAHALVGDDAEREHVAACVDLLAADALGRHVRRGPEHGALAGERTALRPFDAALRSDIAELRDAEVRELDRPVACDEHVVRLEVTVGDPVLVGERHRVQQLFHDGGGLRRRQLAVLQDVAQGGSPDELHDDDRALVVDGSVVHGDDAGVVQTGRRPRFAHEAATVLQTQVVAAGGREQGLLDGDLPIEGGVVPQPHDRHGAASQHAADLERPDRLVGVGHLTPWTPSCPIRILCRTHDALR